MSTIKQVADLAKVSVGTVSHVVTGSVQVSEALRIKVQAAIERLDYHPNHVARSLKTSRTRTLGIVVPDLTISFFPQIIRGADTAARQRGYSLMAVTSADSLDRQKELLTLLRSQRVEGVFLIIAAGPAPAGQMSRMMEAGIPVICVDRIPDRLAVDSVCVDDLAGAEMGVEHLLSMGYDKIAIVTGPLSLENERRRLQGYTRALKRAGRGREEELVWQGNLVIDDVAAMCRRNLAAGTYRPDAVFCTNGPTAIGALRALAEHGFETPRDIGFLTFDELTAYDLFSPRITTIVQPAYEIGFQAAGILLDRIERGKAVGDPLTVRLPATLTVRDSTRRVTR